MSAQNRETLIPFLVRSALAQSPSLLVHADTMTHHKFRNIRCFCTKNCGRPHLKNPPCPQNVHTAEMAMEPNPERSRSGVRLYFLDLNLNFWEKSGSGAASEFGMNDMVYIIWNVYVKAWQRWANQSRIRSQKFGG